MLSGHLTQEALAVDKKPVTTSGVSILHLCMPPERSLTYVPESLSGKAHCKIEDIIIKAYREAFNAHKSNHTELELLNAGISGQTTGKGPNLLTFATMNGFRRLALWGLKNGADINRRDLDGKTMLYSSIYYVLPYMLNFSLSRGADINRIFYIGNQPTTALRAMIDNKWPLDSLESIIKKGAVTRDEREQRLLAQYTTLSRIKAHIISDLTRWSGNKVHFNESKASYLIPVSMAKTMDNYLRYYMETGYLSRSDMDAFEIHGRRFEHFLAINGFSESLEYRLHYNLPKRQAENRIFIRDSRGDDVLQAAIRSLNYDTIQTVLKLSNYGVNQKIPNRPSYKNSGDEPLDTARRLHASEDLIKLLISYNANPYRR